MRSNEKPPRLLLSVAEVAYMLRLAPKTVYEACYSGEMRSIRVNTHVRIPREAVTEWIERKAAETDARMGIRRPVFGAKKQARR